MKTKAGLLAIVSQIRRVPTYYAAQYAIRIERATRNTSARYTFEDGSVGQFVSEIDERSHNVMRFEEVQA